jgi:bifunctional pyridoxal-dependent enzyme with beta-cystathionase and maltose regulon repressor activities
VPFLVRGVALKSQRSAIAKVVRVILVKEMRQAMVNGKEFMNQDFVMAEVQLSQGQIFAELMHQSFHINFSSSKHSLECALDAG